MKYMYKGMLVAGLLFNLASLVSMDNNNQLAEAGNVEKMVPLIEKELFLASMNMNSLHKEHLKKAGEWFARYYIRILQDVACCCKKAEMLEFMQNYIERQDFAKEIAKSLSKTELNKMYLEQLSWVEQKTNNHELPEPLWIMRYSWDTLREFPVQILISQSEWQEKRVAELKELKSQFAALQIN